MVTTILLSYLGLGFLFGAVGVHLGFLGPGVPYDGILRQSLVGGLYGIMGAIVLPIGIISAPFIQ